jgi:hypothetical protein
MAASVTTEVQVVQGDHLLVHFHETIGWVKRQVLHTRLDPLLEVWLGHLRVTVCKNAYTKLEGARNIPKNIPQMAVLVIRR